METGSVPMGSVRDGAGAGKGSPLAGEVTARSPPQWQRCVPLARHGTAALGLPVLLTSGDDDVCVLCCLANGWTESKAGGAAEWNGFCNQCILFSIKHSEHG